MPAVVSPNYKTVWKRNPISGHEWPEYIPLSTFSVTGGTALSSDRNYRTLKAAQDRADSINNSDYVIPRTPRELAYVANMKLQIERNEARRRTPTTQG